MRILLSDDVGVSYKYLTFIHINWVANIWKQPSDDGRIVKKLTKRYIGNNGVIRHYYSDQFRCGGAMRLISSFCDDGTNKWYRYVNTLNGKILEYTDYEGNWYYFKHSMEFPFATYEEAIKDCSDTQFLHDFKEKLHTNPKRKYDEEGKYYSSLYERKSFQLLTDETSSTFYAPEILGNFRTFDDNNFFSF